MPEDLYSTSQLIKNLFKLNEKEHPVIIHKLVSLFKSRVKNGDYTAINNEIRALEYLKQQAIENARKTYPLVLDPFTGEPKTNITFDQYTLAWNVELTIDPNSNHRLKDRPIKISLLHRSSNNNFAPPEIKKMFLTKVEAALSFYPGDLAFKNAIDRFAGNLDATSHNHSTFAHEIKLLCSQYSIFSQAVKDHDDKIIDQYFASIVDLQDRLITRLAIELIRKQKNDNLYNPNSLQIKEAKKLLKEREIELISSKARPIIMHGYFQESSKPKVIQAILVTCEPITDVSSDLRTFPEDQLSNYWKVTNQSLQFKAYPKIPGSIEKIFKQTLREKIVHNFYRSASIAELIDNVPDEDPLIRGINPKIETDESDDPEAAPSIHGADLVKREITVLKKVLTNLAKQQLIARLIAGNDDLNKALVVKIHFNTVLTPIFSREFSRSLTSLVGKNLLGLGNTLLKGNELEQLMSMMLCFEQIENEKFQFSQKDINEIKQAVMAARPRINHKNLDKLEQIIIKPKISYSNVSVNKDPLFGLPATALDFNSFNKQYNFSGMTKIVRNIEDYIDENYPNDTKMQLDLRNLFRLAINADKYQWEAFHSNLAQKANALGDPIKSIAKHFIRINKHLKGLSIDERNSETANAYMVASADIFVLNQLLGFDVHLTCKSGKDRTGMVSLLREALIDADNNDMLIDNICNALKYSAAKTMNEFNVPGGKGLQVDNDILDGLQELFGNGFTGQERIGKILEEQRSRQVSALSRKFYRSTKAADSWIKENKPSEPLASKAQQLVDLANNFRSTRFSLGKTISQNPFLTRDRIAKQVKSEIKATSTATQTAVVDSKQPSLLMQELQAMLNKRNQQQSSLTKHQGGSD